MHARRLATRFAALTLAALTFAPSPASRADDTELFTPTVVPNVLLVIDNSGSMNNIMWHPAFDPSVASSCNYWENGEEYNVNSSSSDTTPDPSDPGDVFKDGSSYSIPSPVPAGCVASAREIFVDSAVQADGNNTRWTGEYLNWYYSAAANAYVSEITALNNGSFSSCLGGGTFHKYRRARVTAAQNVLKDVICQVNQQGEVRFGLAQFRTASSNEVNGGYVLVPINDYHTTTGTPHVYTLNSVNQSHGDHLDDAIESLEGETWTPLSETMFSVYTYFMSRNTSDLPVGQDGSTDFPKYSYRPRETGTGGDHSSTGSGVPVSPVQWHCQKNFVVLITDGEPTRDDFDVASPTSTAQGYGDFDDLIGDYNADGEDEEPPPDPDICPTGFSDCETTLYLDDITKFMHERDFRPDLNGEQTLDVYTVGLTTGVVANALLQKAASVANGQFHTSNNAEELAVAIIESVTDIIEKSQAFTAATVPASRTAAGEQLYVSLFTPTKGAYWQGHLRSYRLTGAGDILDANGDCAVDDPSGSCFSGAFLPTTEAPPFWDAADELPAPASRELRASVLRGATPAPTTAEFEAQVAPPTSGITAADLGITFPPATTPGGSVATNADQYAAEIVANVRGCNMGTGANGFACVEREAQLGDIFHSNPVVVGQPALFEGDPSYRTGFKGLVEDRDRVIYAGSNGGFLHGFHAGDWLAGETPPHYDEGTGEEIFGFMPWPSRQTIWNKPLDTHDRDYYFVDGSPTVADAWLYTDHTVGTKLVDGSEWRTLLVGGLRQGGRAYYALDVTQPGALLCQAPATGDGYPCYLWEFPKENDSAANKDWVGETWGDPIITKVRVQVGADVFERWVAVVSGGYHASSDPNAHAAYSATSKLGRSIWVIDLKTGKPLAQRKFDTAGSCPDGTYDAANPERGMCFAMASTPAVYDVDGDGFADVIYAPDLGGNLWKWVIKAPLTLSDATTASQPATDWPFRKFFGAPVYDSGSALFYKSFFFPPGGTRKNGKLWLALGSGERNNVTYLSDPDTDEDNNRFYVIEEIDVFDTQSPPAAVVVEDPDLANLTSDSTCADLGSFRGYFITGQEGEKWLTNVEIFVGYVIANSHVAEEDNGDPCDIPGTSFLWAFRVQCGEGLFTDGSGDPVRSLDIGSGLPTDPRVTVGSSGDSSNRVIISKQGGDIINVGAPPGFPASGAFYWRELSDD